MNMLAALRLQIEWGADEALGDNPIDRMAAPAPIRAERDIGAAERPSLPAAAPVGHPVRRAEALAAGAATVEALLEALAGFDGCGLSSTATKLVFADGDPTARLMLVGDCPGAEEDRAGLPFVGPAGRLLDRMLASIGLDRSQVLLTTLVPWRPPGNRAPTETEVQICLPFLLRHIALVRPARLVLLGALASHALLGTKGSIGRLRGRWTMAQVPGLPNPIPALPMLQPSLLLQNPASRREAWVDLLSLRRSLDSGP